MSETGIIPPILLIWFNRPHHAQRVLERLREVRPTHLYVAIDGPRYNHPTDGQQVSECISLLEKIDWPCKVEKLIRVENLGCKRGVSSAIDWFFGQVGEGIILEDDCLPDATFFSFCAEMLTRYRHEKRVMHVNGCNLADDHRWSNDSYIFTTVCHIWGWATWRRAWQCYDVDMQAFSTNEAQGRPYDVLPDRESARFWQKGFRETHGGHIDSWDYQWVYALWLNKGLCILPDRNLVQNIGFGSDATHTVQKNSPYANLRVSPMQTIIHPQTVRECYEASKWLFKRLYSLPSWTSRLRAKLTSKLGQ
jgi:hypothetical protein